MAKVSVLAPSASLLQPSERRHQSSPPGSQGPPSGDRRSRSPVGADTGERQTGTQVVGVPLTVFAVVDVHLQSYWASALRPG